jgi:ABC-type multidrug transport system fused ATPase/permease subunit
MGVEQPIVSTLPLAEPKPHAREAAALPRTLTGYVWRYTARHQIALALLAVVVFMLSAVPLEIQRRIVNDAISKGAVSAILWLAVAYIAVALTEGAVKLALNIYRGWVSETAVRHLRRVISTQIDDASALLHTAEAEGVEISMILSEAEPVGGFVGISVSEPLLHGGVLASVLGYMIYLQPQMAVLCVIVLIPQLVFVPLLQRAINRRAAARIRTLRAVSGGILDAAPANVPIGTLQNGRIDRVFALNMGIYKLKFSMNFLMNGLHHLSVAATLGIGGWYAVMGKTDVGTVVAFVSGLVKINDPWGDVVNWFREMTVSAVKYRLIADASAWLDARRRGISGRPPAV